MFGNSWGRVWGCQKRLLTAWRRACSSPKRRWAMLPSVFHAPAPTPTAPRGDAGVSRSAFPPPEVHSQPWGEDRKRGPSWVPVQTRGWRVQRGPQAPGRRAEPGYRRLTGGSALTDPPPLPRSRCVPALTAGARRASANPAARSGTGRPRADAEDSRPHPGDRSQARPAGALTSACGASSGRTSGRPAVACAYGGGAGRAAKGGARRPRSGAGSDWPPAPSRLSRGSAAPRPPSVPRSSSGVPSSFVRPGAPQQTHLF